MQPRLSSSCRSPGRFPAFGLSFTCEKSYVSTMSKFTCPTQVGFFNVLEHIRRIPAKPVLYGCKTATKFLIPLITEAAHQAAVARFRNLVGMKRTCRCPCRCSATYVKLGCPAGAVGTVAPAGSERRTELLLPPTATSAIRTVSLNQNRNSAPDAVPCCVPARRLTAPDGSLILCSCPSVAPALARATDRITPY